MVDLDKSIEIMTKSSLENKELDVLNENVMMHGDIYNDYYKILEKVKSLPNHSPCPFGVQIPQIIDINNFISYDDEEFIELVYIYLFRRPADESGMKNFLNVLNNKQMTKNELIYNLAQSEEAKNLNVSVTGFDIMPLDWFMGYNDREFVENAYVLLLGRYPDETGMNGFLTELRGGYASKVDILWQIVKSDEAVARNVDIYGLDREFQNRRNIRRILKMPVIGKVSRFVIKSRRAHENVNWLINALNEKDKTINELTQQINYQRNVVNDVEQKIWNVNNELANKINHFELKVNEIEKKSTGYLENINEAKNEITENRKNIELTKKWIEDHHRRLNEIEKFSNGVGENVNAINKALEQNDAILREYKFEDKKNLQMLLTEYCNIKVKLDELCKKGISISKSNSEMINATEEQVSVSSNEYESIDYFDFENHFRGSREHIKKVQTIYLPYFEGKKNVLDLGCGRGEFTEMLKEHGVGVTGVDQYAPYVEYMKMLGLPVVLDDATNYLKSQESVDGIFVGQVVEHISVGQIIELCKLAYEKMEDGTYLIMETPNPTSLAIYTNSFYMDPSHQKPIHPQTLKYIAEKAGFTSVEILYTESSRLPFEIPEIKIENENLDEFNQAMERVSELLYGSQDYSIIARK